MIAVVDDGGNLMALERLDGTFAAGANISIGKARTAALFKKPTAFFEDIIRKGRTPMVALNDFTPLQGGVPIVVGDQVVGAVGVSGAASAQQDEEMAMAGAAAVAGAGVEEGAEPRGELLEEPGRDCGLREGRGPLRRERPQLHGAREPPGRSRGWPKFTRSTPTSSTSCEAPPPS